MLSFLKMLIGREAGPTPEQREIDYVSNMLLIIQKLNKIHELDATQDRQPAQLLRNLLANQELIRRALTNWEGYILKKPDIFTEENKQMLSRALTDAFKREEHEKNLAIQLAKDLEKKV